MSEIYAITTVERRYERLKRIIYERYRLSIKSFVEFLKRLDYVLMVFGPPGTGKTHNVLATFLTGRLGDKHLPGYFSIENSLYAAFNRSAADDAARRLQTMAVESLDRDRLAGIDVSAHVKTLDAVALSSIGGAEKLLRLNKAVLRRETGGVHVEYTPCSGWNCAISDAEEAIEIARMLVSKKHNISYVPDIYEQSEGRLLFQLFDFAVHVAGLQKALEALEKNLTLREQYAIRDYLRLLEPPKRVDFTLANAFAALQGAEYKIEERIGRHKEERDVEALFLDEFQDLSPLRLTWIPRLFPKARIAVLAGDDDQAIYTSLHGADPSIMKLIYDKIKNGEINGDVVVLKESRRLYEPVAAIARALISRVENRVPKEWRGKNLPGATAHVHVVSFERGIKMIAKNHHENFNNFTAFRSSFWRQFVLAATNAEVKEIVKILLLAGVIPLGLKGVPSFVKKIVETAVEACDAVKNEEDAKKMMGTDSVRLARVKYMTLKLNERNINIADAVTRATTCDGFRQLKEFIDEVERQRGRDPTWLTRYVTYVDTAYVAKGLEADTVFVVDSTSSELALYDVRAKYVALTRSKGNVYIMKGGPGRYRWMPELDAIAEVARP